MKVSKPLNLYEISGYSWSLGGDSSPQREFVCPPENKSREKGNADLRIQEQVANKLNVYILIKVYVVIPNTQHNGLREEPYEREQNLTGKGMTNCASLYCEGHKETTYKAEIVLHLRHLKPTKVNTIVQALQSLLSVIVVYTDYRTHIEAP